MIHLFFENVYYRYTMAVLLAILLAFAKEVDVLSEWWMPYLLTVVLGVLVFNNLYDDYGLVLLTIAIFALTWNNLLRKKRVSNK